MSGKPGGGKPGIDKGKPGAEKELEGEQERSKGPGVCVREDKCGQAKSAATPSDLTFRARVGEMERWRIGDWGLREGSSGGEWLREQVQG